MEKLEINEIKALFSLLNKVFQENKDYLIELDGVMGDGDLGLTMATIFKAADEFSAGFDGTDLGVMLMKAGMEMSRAAPSTMGTLMATGFMRGGKSLKGTEILDVSGMTSFWNAFVHGIMERGKSAPGEKTIVDSLYPAFESLEKSSAEGLSLCDAMTASAKAAEEGLQKTKTMIAQHGRAAYYQEKSRDAQDPGATVGYIVVKTFSDYINGGAV